MRTIEVVVIAGIRAQFMKLAAFQSAVEQWNTSSLSKFKMTYINSGQHYDDDLAGSFIRELNVRFDIDLTGRYKDLRPIWLLGDMIAVLYDEITNIDSPDWVIVFGDANTTLAGALAASKLGLSLIHVEAGLRTKNPQSPEEVNRVVSDHLAIVHFVSSKHDIINLEKEGLLKNAIWTGDLIGDLVTQLSPTLSQFTVGGYTPGEYILASIHREENVESDAILKNLIQTLNSYHRKIIFIAHPRVRRRLQKLSLYELRNIKYFQMLPYKTMLSAIKGCAFLVTDSGAFQREAYYLKKRCLIRQDNPFWISLVEAGIHKPVGISPSSINSNLQWAEQAMKTEYPVIDDLGDGNAGKRILQHIVKLTIESNCLINQIEDVRYSK